MGTAFASSTSIGPKGPGPVSMDMGPSAWNTGTIIGVLGLTLMEGDLGTSIGFSDPTSMDLGLASMNLCPSTDTRISSSILMDRGTSIEESTHALGSLGFGTSMDLSPILMDQDMAIRVQGLVSMDLSMSVGNACMSIGVLDPASMNLGLASVYPCGFGRALDLGQTAEVLGTSVAMPKSRISLSSADI